MLLQTASSYWGARQVGKNTLSESLFPNAPYYDLQNSCYGFPQ